MTDTTVNIHQQVVATGRKRPALTTDEPVQTNDVLLDIDDLAAMPVDAQIEYANGLQLVELRHLVATADSMSTEHGRRRSTAADMAGTLREFLRQCASEGETTGPPVRG